MALVRKDTDLPRDAVIINRESAIVKQWELVYDWKPFSDLWAIRMSTYVTCCTNLATGLYIHQFYRRKLKLGNFGFTASFLPLVFMPSIFGSIMHRTFITTPILINDEFCPSCTQIKAIGYQMVTGVIYPLILGPMCSYMLASRYDVARIPMIYPETRKLWEFHKHLSRPLYRKMTYFAAFNLFATAFMTYYEFDNVININNKMLAAEEFHKAKMEKIDRHFEQTSIKKN